MEEAMETASYDSLERDDTTKHNSQGNNEIRFLYLALNDEAGFERAVNARGKGGRQRAVNSTLGDPDASSRC